MRNRSNMTSAEAEMYQYCQDNGFQGSIATMYVHWFLIPAVAVIMVLSFMEKRKYIKPDLLGGRPALVRPLGFLDEPNNRWGIMFVFGSVTANIIQVSLKTLLSTLNFPVWAKIFMVYILCLETSVICYPLFACMTTRHKLAGAITGLLYSLGWLIFELFIDIQIGRCYEFRHSDLNNNTATIYVSHLPVVICDLLVVLKFCWKLYKCIKSGVYEVSYEDQMKLCKSSHKTYVKHLLNKNNIGDRTESLTWRQKIMRRIVRPIPGFRFPISILITTFMSGVMLYKVVVALFFAMWTAATNSSFVDLLQATNFIATIITILCGIRNIYLFLMNYKRDMLLMFKGDRSFIPKIVQTPSPNVYMAQGMRFIGTAIIGTLYGTVFCFLFVYIPLALMMIVIRFLKQEGKLNDIWEEFQWLVYPFCMIVIFKMQVFFIGRFFIQPKLNKEDKYRPLAVDNRNAFDIFSFFMIFLNASIGVFAFLKRILIGAFLGVFLIPRMDRSLLMRGYEAMDKCYVNYIGMIMVNVAHNHPVMRVFCFLVKSEVEDRRDRKPLQTAVDNVEYGGLSFCQHIPVGTSNSVAKRRWLLAMTLIRNPSLVPLRVRVTKQESVRSTLQLQEIQFSKSTTTLDKDQSEDTWGFSISCKNYKFKIPPNIVTNIMALIVLLSILVIYTGVPLLLKDLAK